MSQSVYRQLAQAFAQKPDRASRRDILRSAVAASASLLISGCISVPHVGKRPSSKRIIIIGAGLAGLACAYELDRAGYDVNVFEARQQVGGRVLSLRKLVPGRSVEAGGEYIAAHHAVWLAYAEQFYLSLHEVNAEQKKKGPIVFDGRRLDERQAQALWEEASGALSRLRAEAEAVINVDEPWQTPKAEQFDRRSAADWIAALDVSPACKKLLTTEFECNNGVSTQRQSYLANLTQIKGGGLKYWPEGVTFRCEEGNQRLAVKMARVIGADRIKLDTPVVAIQSKGSIVRVSTADGSTYEAEEVVLAVPPAIWSKIHIYPPLPDELKPQMGLSVKYLCQLSDPFWQSSQASPTSLMNGDINLTWRGTRSPMPWERTDPLAPVPVALVALSGGSAAEAVRARAASERDARYLDTLENLYPGFRKHLVRSQFMDWPSDQWTMGGYSFPAPGEVTKIGPILYQGHGQLHFAGEHCCYSHIGTMEGALISGASLAKRLAARDGILT